MWYNKNKVRYYVENFITKPMQLERVKPELKRRSYEFPKFVCACHKINWVINSSMGFILKQCYQVIDNINKKL
jgi:hypothetical protein